MSLYLTTEELSTRIKYEPRYIRERMKDRIFKKGVHYIQPFNGRKILFVWDEIEKIMQNNADITWESQNPMEGIILRRSKVNG